MFNERDIALLSNKGISTDKVNKQIAYFKSGFPFLQIKSAAVVGDGIVRYAAQEIENLVKKYDSLTQGLEIVKFVPASGAATRMFKDLYEFLGDGKMSPAVSEVLENLSKFAFYDKLTAITGKDASPEATIGAITGEGLNYGKLPKALILFHRYADGNRTAIEEHIAEGAMYAKMSNGKVRIHITVSPEHRSAFEELMKAVLPKYEQRYNAKLEITYSQQKPSTDTIAVDMENNPLREADGSLIFRPAGHGALLENLSEIDADLIYIKTVDNVAPDRLKADTVAYKKALASILLETQQRCFEYLYAMSCGANESLVDEVAEFVKHDLAYKLESGFSLKSVKEQSTALKAILDRPIRICGMVKNEGEPGGGPFWVANPDGSQSLQIVESSQISPQQKDLMKNSTHFNPVDIVCSTKGRRNYKFDLRKFSDPNTGFISIKSKNGQELKAQELPGLWNGAMAKWNTIFVEVPISTFSPVKIVNDLLRPQHQ